MTWAPRALSVDAMHIWAFPSNGAAPSFPRRGDLRLRRDDVGAAFGSAFTNSGYQLNVSRLASGTTRCGVRAQRTITGTLINRGVTITVPTRGGDVQSHAGPNRRR